LRWSEQQGLLKQKLGSPSWYEDARFDGYPQSCKLGPSNDLLQRHATHPAQNHAFEVIRRSRAGEQHVSLVFGEYAAGHS
jgi:hypothetical protein